MSLTAAASGFLLVLLSASVIQGQNDWRVTYSSTQICALKGSTLDIQCTYRYPYTINRNHTKVWFTKWTDSEPVDLKTDSEYSARVQYSSNNNDCTLRISDLRESDSAEYKFRFITNRGLGRFTGSPGVTLSVTDLRVQVTRTHPTLYPSWANLHCQSSCRLPDNTSYIWYRNRHKIKEDRSPNYADYIYDSTDIFSCAVKGYENFPSHPLILQVHNDWRVTYSSTQICALKGSTVVILCIYTFPSRKNGHDTNVRETTWFTKGTDSEPVDLKTDSEYSGRVQYSSYNNDCTLRISDLRESDSAEYKFRFITNQDLGRHTGSPGVTLSVTDLQVQVTRPYPTLDPSWANLLCQSSCLPPDHTSYIWYRNGHKIKEDRSPHFEVMISAANSYSCAVTGFENFRSPSVYAPRLPSLSVSPSEIVEGSSVNLTCSSDANPAASYTWYKKNQHLPFLRTGPQLVFDSIQSSDSGEYYCTALNQLGSRTSESISVHVQYPPRLPSVSVSPSEIVEGSSVTLTCSSDANPAANYTWYKENQTLFQGPEGSYHFPSISSEDRGTYHCKPENQHGKINSSSLFLNVQYAPRLPSVSVSPSAEIVEGSSVTLTCSSDANPAASYTWYKENEDSPKASGQIFTITDFRAEHSGSYSCEAQNSRGRRNSTLHLTVTAGHYFSGSGSLTAAVTITVILLVIISLSVFLWIRKARSPGNSSEPEEMLDNREQGSEELQYASIRFSNVRPAQPVRHMEDFVEYATVNFRSGGPAPRARNQETGEDPAALYSTVNKTQRPQEALH